MAGTAAAAAALYGHYLVLPGWLTGPEVCLMEDGGCAVLFRSPRSRLLGLPNALFGIVLYVLLAVGLLRGWDPAATYSERAERCARRASSPPHCEAPQLLGPEARLACICHRSL